MEVLVVGNIGDGCAVLSLELALEHAQIWYAMDVSRTWGEFKSLVSEERFAELEEIRSDMQEEAEKIDLDAEFEMPFDVSENSWPGRVREDMLTDLDQDLQDRFVRRDGDNAMSGIYAFIDLARMEEFRAALRLKEYITIVDDALLMASQGFATGKETTQALARYGVSPVTGVEEVVTPTPAG